MEDIEQIKAELDHLKAMQEIHRRQLEENRQAALQRKRDTRRLVSLGKMVEELLPDAAGRTEDEIRDILAELLNSRPLYEARNSYRFPGAVKVSPE